MGREEVTMTKGIHPSLLYSVLLCMLHITSALYDPSISGQLKDTISFEGPKTVQGRDGPLHRGLHEETQDKSGVSIAWKMGGYEADKADLKLAQKDLLANFNSPENVNNDEASVVDLETTRHQVVFKLDKQAAVLSGARASEEMARPTKSHRPKVRLARQVPQTNTFPNIDTNDDLDNTGTVKARVNMTNSSGSMTEDASWEIESSQIPESEDVPWTTLSNEIPTDILNNPVPTLTFTSNPPESAEYTGINTNTSLNPNTRTASSMVTSDDDNKVRNLSLRNLPSDSDSNDRTSRQEQPALQLTRKTTKSSPPQSQSRLSGPEFADVSSTDHPPAKNWNDTELTISLTVDGDSMLVRWTFDEENEDITGFEVSYRMNSREQYDSSRLEKQVRSFTLHSLHADEEYVICVHAMVNNTAVKEACANWSEASMKIVIGIMAGTIFLVPCIAVVIWILHKDRLMKDKYAAYDKVEEAPECSEKICADAGHAHSSQCHQKHEITHKKQGKRSHKTSTSGSSTDKSLGDQELHDTGHENPCTDTDENGDNKDPWKRQTRQEAEVISSSPVSGSKHPNKSQTTTTGTDSSSNQSHSNISGDNTPASSSSVVSTPSIPKDSLALKVDQLPKDHPLGQNMPGARPATIVQKSNNDVATKANSLRLSTPDMTNNTSLATSTGVEMALPGPMPQVCPQVPEQSDYPHPGDLVIVTHSSTVSTDNYEGTKL